MRTLLDFSRIRKKVLDSAFGLRIALPIGDRGIGVWRETIDTAGAPALEPKNVNRGQDRINQEIEEKRCKDLTHLALVGGNNGQRERGMPHRCGDGKGGTMIGVPSAEQVTHNQATNADQGHRQ